MNKIRLDGTDYFVTYSDIKFGPNLPTLTQLSRQAIEADECLPPLIRVGTPHTMAMEEFEIYAQRMREVSGQKRQKAKQHSLSTPIPEEVWLPFPYGGQKQECMSCRHALLIFP